MVVKIVDKEKAGFRIIIRDLEFSKTKSFSLSKNSSKLEDLYKKVKSLFE